jgi:NAD(P)-dependent dehydrogenase (short-subunit alcohol dehydrogenase family)
VLINRPTAEGIQGGRITLVLRREDAARAKPRGMQAVPTGRGCPRHLGRLLRPLLGGAGHIVNMGDPYEDIAPVAVFLASEGCRDPTGNTLFVNGGSHSNGVAWHPTPTLTRPRR